MSLDGDLPVRKDVDWPRFASSLVKSSLKRRDMTYADLVKALGKFGVQETEPNLRNKLSRGSFSAAFLLQCLAAIGASYISIDDVFDTSGLVRVTSADRS